MKDNRDKFKKWAEKQVEYYKPYLNINLQEIKIEFSDSVNYLAITFSYPYLEPYIKFSDKAVDAWLKNNLPKKRILHELCHILTDPLYAKAISRFSGQDEIESERERLTDKFCIILNNLIK